MFLSFTPTGRGEPMLDHHVALYFPTKRGNGDSIFAESWGVWLNAAKVSFANLFGGYTIHEGKGGFMSPEHGRLIEEDVLVLNAYCTNRQLADGAVHVRGLAGKLRFALTQECVALVIDGRMEFVL